MLRVKKMIEKNARVKLSRIGTFLKRVFPKFRVEQILVSGGNCYSQLVISFFCGLFFGRGCIVGGSNFDSTNY